MHPRTEIGTQLHIHTCAYQAMPLWRNTCAAFHFEPRSKCCVYFRACICARRIDRPAEMVNSGVDWKIYPHWGKGVWPDQQNEKRYRISVYTSRLWRASLPHSGSAFQTRQEPNRRYYFLSEGQGDFSETKCALGFDIEKQGLDEVDLIYFRLKCFELIPGWFVINFRGWDIYWTTINMGLRN